MPYTPLSSVWEKSDAEWLAIAIPFYHSAAAPRIIDCTHNAGRFWKGSARKIVSVDIDPLFACTHCCDNKNIPEPNESFDVVVYDPPHLVIPSKNRYTEFGIGRIVPPRGVWTIAGDFPPFLKEAFRLLAPNGIVLAKIQDVVNNHRSQWEHLAFLRAAIEAGFTACDMIVKIRKGPMKSPGWKRAHHARKRHCFWIVLRKGKCERH